ncbi:hypothetical protein C0J52_26831 [Blattella germanica]|nr:hypothetical protein C0J52_26831 [Blattella germanica]
MPATAKDAERSPKVASDDVTRLIYWPIPNLLNVFVLYRNFLNILWFYKRHPEDLCPCRLALGAFVTSFQVHNIDNLDYVILQANYQLSYLKSPFLFFFLFFLAV